MIVIQLANGNLLVPESALSPDGQVLADAYVEVGKDDPDFARLAEHAIGEAEYAQRRQQWQDGDAELRRAFLDYLSRNGSSGGWNDDEPGLV
jgi:post-segregation antitoxin (ccd killing protein)